MGFKKSEIAVKVFERLDAVPATPVAGGPLEVSIKNVAALGLVPWFCDVSVQWAFRITDPAGPLKKNALPKVANTFAAAVDGRLLVGVPGDGIEPATYTLKPLADAIV